MCSRHCHDTNINILEFIDTKESEVNKSVSEAENAHAEKEEVWMRQYAEKRAREEASKREETRKAAEKARAREEASKREETRKATEKARAREEASKREETRKAAEKERFDPPSEYYTDPDGIRVSGGPRVDPEIARKQKERVQELRRVQMKKESDAREMAEVQKRVDREVDLWSQSKDLLTMLRTFNHILPGFPVIQMDCSVRKAYMNALRMVHPDKIDQNASVETKATAQRVFTKLRENKP